MTVLFDRRLALRVFRGGVVETFTDHDMSVDVQLVSTSDPNTANVGIWGLSERQRGLFDAQSQYIEVLAGYGDDVGMIFRGSWDPERSIARHRKDGPDWVTEIETGDGLREVHSAFLSRTYSAGTPVARIIADCVASMGLPVSLEWTRPETLPHAATFSARCSTVLDELAWLYKFDWSVQYGGIVVTERGEPSKTAGVVAVLSPTTGMVGRPVATESGIEVKTMMLYGIKPKGLIRIVDDQLPTKITELARIAKKAERPIRVSDTGVYVVDSVQYIGDNRSGDFACQIKADYA
jgi:hypothetical protein